MIDFEPVTLVLSLLLFGAFCVPFIYHSLKNKKKNAHLVAKLNEASSQLGAKPSVVESWRNQYAIGLDETRKVLSYYQQGEVEQAFSFHLKDYRKIQIVKTTLESQPKSQTKPILQHLALELTPDSGGKSVQLEIFDGEQFSDLMGETVLADKWKELIQKNLN